MTDLIACPHRCHRLRARNFLRLAVLIFLRRSSSWVSSHTCCRQSDADSRDDGVFTSSFEMKSFASQLISSNS